MSQRFFCNESLTQDQVQLDDQEAHHLIHVMRLAVGEEVLLFDGSGLECLARIEKIGRRDVQLAVLSRETIDRELPFSLTLAVALPKGDRQKWLVEKAVELGVTRLIPLVTERSVAQPVGKALARLRRAVIEASKQCRRNRLMEIAEPETCLSLLERPAGDSRIALLAHPDSTGKAVTVGQLASRLGGSSELGGSDVIVGVGPEGGFSEDEVQAAIDAGWQPLDLGQRILRIETAALAIAAQLVGLANSTDR